MNLYFARRCCGQWLREAACVMATILDDLWHYRHIFFNPIDSQAQAASKE